MVKALARLVGIKNSGRLHHTSKWIEDDNVQATVVLTLVLPKLNFISIQGNTRRIITMIASRCCLDYQDQLLSSDVIHFSNFWIVQLFQDTFRLMRLVLVLRVELPHDFSIE